MILATLNRFNSLGFRPPRQYVWGFAVGWWTHTVVQYGQYTILQEVPFGGYQFHLRWNDFWWAGNSATWHIDKPIDFLYATAPGSSTPIDAGSILFGVKFDTGLVKQVLYEFTNQPSDGHYTYQEFPRLDSSYWSPVGNPAINPPLTT